MIIFPMCHLSKIFVEEYQQELMKNPALIWDESKPFSFLVSTSRRDHRFRSDQPSFLTDANLVSWLTGGTDGMQCQEMDWTGLIKLDLDAVQNGSILAAIAGVRKVGEEVEQGIEAAKAQAKLLSKQRVMRQIRAVNGAMLKQYEINKQDGKGLYTPSVTEYLCAYVLAEEQQKNSAAKQEISQKFAELMAATFGG